MSENTSQQHEFRAETQKVLQILTHSLYTNREIFLRELIANASDALDKVRYLQGRGDTILAPDLPLDINIHIDKVQNILTIKDNGIGMNLEEMKENLGTIAKSGSEAFLAEYVQNTQKNEDGSPVNASQIIGRFGIGFYSVFMVADKVEVISKNALAEGPAHIWTSEGTGTYTVEEVSEEDAPKRGTIIRVHCKKDALEFLEKYRLESIVRKYSTFLAFPILLDGEHLNTTPALWREPKFSITKEQYAEFYRYLTYDIEDPLDNLHISVDAPVQFNALIFIPAIEQEIYALQREHFGLDLYVRRVLIQKENKHLLPEYLAFFKGLVDTEDLPLNISRETLQENIVLRKIAQTLAKQALTHLERMAENDTELYDRFWSLHGNIFKLGYNDYTHRDRIVPLFRFNSSALADKEFTSFDAYISRAKAGQEHIWYVSAPSREAANANPHLEVFRQKGLEVLYLTDPVDEFALETVGKYKDFSFKAVENADAGLLEKMEDDPEAKKAAAEKAKPLSNEGLKYFEGLVTRIEEILGDKILEVRVSQRLTDSPACLVTPGEGMTSSMDKILRVMQKDESVPKKIFEINRDHPLLRSLLHVYEKDANDPVLELMVTNMFDTSLLLDGYVGDPLELAKSLGALLEKAGEWYAGHRK